MAISVSIDPEVFDPSSIPPETLEFNKKLMDLGAAGPRWYEVGAAKYRQMRAKGETPLPGVVHLDSASDFLIPSREAGRSIPCRILKPTNRPTNSAVTGVFMHVHGGGWVLQDEKSQDGMLQDIANSTGLVVVSIGYRKAPEHPFPAGPEDCFDSIEWLITHSESQFGSPLTFLGGESAGGHLAILSLLHILQHPDPTFSQFHHLKGVMFHYGAYDLTWSPSVYNFNPERPLVLDWDILQHYIAAFLPPEIQKSDQKRRHPSVSPLFADFQSLRGKLPPALFTCGTQDPLIDDTVFMSARYQAAGAKTEVEIYSGAPHGYIAFPRELRGSLSYKGLDAVAKFVNKINA